MRRCRFQFVTGRKGVTPLGKAQPSPSSVSFRGEPIDIVILISARVRDHKGGSTISFAAFCPHRAHFSRSVSRSSEPTPPIFVASYPLTVLVDPQALQSIRKLHLNLTRSETVRTCLVDMVRRYVSENDS